MRKRLYLLVFIPILFLSSCELINFDNLGSRLRRIMPSPVEPSNTPITGESTSFSKTYLPMCTPPLCAIGTSEVYFCAASCPNGCGTTCATYTPSPTP